MTGRLDRDAARDVVINYWKVPPKQWDQMLDALEGCVRPAPAQTIDRDMLDRLLTELLDEPQWSRIVIRNRIIALGNPVKVDRAEIVENIWLESGVADRGTCERIADRVLALLRPVDGVTLTREEATLAASALRFYSVNVRTPRGHGTRLDLAARLEAAS